nr:hypothetical protein [Burkholderia ambifaria]
MNRSEGGHPARSMPSVGRWNASGMRRIVAIRTKDDTDKRAAPRAFTDAAEAPARAPH